MPNLKFSMIHHSCPQVGISHTVHEGVLSISGGPNYESVAELKMFSMLGLDCVGKTVSCWYEMSNHLS